MRRFMAGSEVFVDTGFWIAAARQVDAQHERAKVLGRETLERRAKLVISDLVLAEVVTFILKKDGHEPAEKLMTLLNENTTILFVDKPILEDAKSLLRRYWGPRKRLSVCDGGPIHHKDHQRAAFEGPAGGPCRGSQSRTAGADPGRGSEADRGASVSGTSTD